VRSFYCWLFSWLLFRACRIYWFGRSGGFFLLY